MAATELTTRGRISISYESKDANDTSFASINPKATPTSLYRLAKAINLLQTDIAKDITLIVSSPIV